MVKNRNKTIVIIILISIALLSNSCKINENHDNEERQFNKLYLEIVNNINYNDTQGSIKILQSAENRAKIEQLKMLLESMENYLIKQKKEVYNVYLKQYMGLEFLSNLDKEWKDMSLDERSQATTEIGIIELSMKIKANK